MDRKLDYHDVLIRPRNSNLVSRSEVSLTKPFYRRVGLGTPRDIGDFGPICAANMDGVGTWEMAKVLCEHFVTTFLNKSYTAEDYNAMAEESMTAFESCAITVGTSENDIEKLMNLSERVRSSLIMLCVDVANGYTNDFLETVASIREQFPKVLLVAGNVVTADQTSALIHAGADIVKIGIGPGSVCTTRIQTGVGYPQLSAVMECAKVAHDLNAYVIADGGCTSPGDVSKALAAGADMVMLGGMLAGHDEGGGEVISKFYKTDEVKQVPTYHGDVDTFEVEWQPVVEERKFVQFYGMSSETANDKHFGGLKDYRAAEGKEVLVPYRGSVEKTIKEIYGGIRSTCTYVGAKNVRELPQRAEFVLCGDTHNRVFE
jgi:GMP reductase